jgi:pimeloyl-ACP methyl ester carboxylesterase
MRRDEAIALGDLAGEAAAGIAGQARDVHAGVARRVFGALRVLGPAAESVRLIHDGVSQGAYAAAGALTGGIVRGSAGVFGRTRSDEDPSLSESVRGRLAVGAINGMWGDRLHGRRGVLQTPMAVRRAGREVSLDAESLAAAFPDATPRIVVFAHGLCETEDAWRLGAGRSVPYGDRLRADLGYTPVYIRYNSGLHISANGRRLAALLDELIENWPLDVAEVALIGHSMGGLVGRAACHYAAVGSWRERVRHVFTLGAPHKGAPLELGANAVCHAAGRVPELTPFAAPIRARAAGVKDLGYGYIVDEDWQGHDPDAFWTNTGTVVPFLDSANHYFVSATLSQEPDAPVGRLIGDLLVLHSSAWAHGGRGERLQFPVDQYTHVGGANHFDLLNHPAVYAQLKKWLGSRRELPAPPAR